MFYIRKLSKPSNLQKVKSISNPAIIPADFIGQEMRTAQNTLSVWRCESLDQVEMRKAIIAAVNVNEKVSQALMNI